MSLQKLVSNFQGQGRAGDIFNNGPTRCQSYTLVDNTQTVPSSNIVGATAYTYAADGYASAGNPAAGTTGRFVGVLVNPNSYALLGAKSTLDPSMIVPSNSQGELATMGTFYLQLTSRSAATGTPGDQVVYNQTDGSLAVVAAGAAVPAGFSGPIGQIDYMQTGALPSLAIVTLTTNYAASVAVSNTQKEAE